MANGMVMFITLEGIEGSGKTTQIPKIVSYLEERGHQCVVTREPGGTAVGEKIRAILLDPDHTHLDAVTELLLYVADRAQHLKQIVRPAIESGKTVICDRYFDATTVYQGYARGLSLERIDALHRMVLGNLKPDLTLLLDLPVERGLSRAWKQIDNGMRTGRETRFEEEALAFHQRVRNGYLQIARQEPSRFGVVDASGSVEDVFRQITTQLRIACK